MNLELSPLPTHYEVLTHIRYSERLHYLHMRYWIRVRTVLTFLLLLSGTGAFATMFVDSNAGKGISALGAWSGLFVAVLSILNHSLAPADKIASHKSIYRSYKTLNGEAYETSAAELYKKIRVIERDEPHDMNSLSMVAYNDTMRSSGHDDLIQPENLTQWFMRKLA